MTPEEVVTLFEQSGFKLSQEQAKQFHTFLKELKKWNRVHNLTALREDKDIVVRHFIDSLSLTACFEELGIDWRGRSIADVGTGAGFPGVPLKIYLRNFNLFLIESVSKKCSFLEVLKVKLGLKWNVLCKRAEEVEQRFDIVLARAMGEFEQVHSILEKLSSRYVLVMKGVYIKEEWVDKLGYEAIELKRSKLPPSKVLWKRVK